jgi:hypothetical protein
MQIARTLRDALFALALAATAASLIGGCATPRHRDWREAVREGDFAHACADLFETWRAGTPDVKSEALRYAWRDPRIVAVARTDLAGGIQAVADGHGGDLASLAKAVKDGPLEDRVEFAKLVDRRIDVDAEIRAAFEKRSPKVASPATIPAPVAAPPPPKPAPAPAVTLPVAPAPPAIAPSAPAAAAATPPPPPPAATPAPPPAAPPAPAPSIAKGASPTVTTLPPAPKPPAATVEKAPSSSAATSDLPARVEDARKRSAWRCAASRCDKAWAAAESFVAANSDMRIRSATPTRIDTYPPIVIGEIGMKVEKRPAGAGESEIQLTVTCRAGRLAHACPTAELRLCKAFPENLRSAAP